MPGNLLSFEACFGTNRIPLFTSPLIAAVPVNSVVVSPSFCTCFKVIVPVFVSFLRSLTLI